LSSAVAVDDLGDPVSYPEETSALKQEVRRVVAGLYGAGSLFAANTLAYRLRKFADA
jgi:hypothetical protein